ncbi:unnamed protein product [Prunus brigantina]
MIRMVSRCLHDTEASTAAHFITGENRTARQKNGLECFGFVEAQKSHWKPKDI